jgi:hypothetical protein
MEIISGFKTFMSFVDGKNVTIYLPGGATLSGEIGKRKNVLAKMTNAACCLSMTFTIVCKVANTPVALSEGDVTAVTEGVNPPIPRSSRMTGYG